MGIHPKTWTPQHATNIKNWIKKHQQSKQHKLTKLYTIDLYQDETTKSC